MLRGDVIHGVSIGSSISIITRD
ncbi:unnamed protein product, partial [Rotaria magnacalcarata]